MEMGTKDTLVMLYPLTFQPHTLPKIWGSEVWVVSALGEYVSQVANGSLQGDSLQDLLETYMDELVGDRVYAAFGNRFPLIAKFIDAQDDLSVQVHPDDMTAYDRHRSLGKTEMWYVVQAEEGAAIVEGFTRELDREELQDLLRTRRLGEVLNCVPVAVGDVAFLPAGRVHALKRGVQVAEIQEASDITYRLYDYDRPGLDGQLRPLHIEQAEEVVDYTPCEESLVSYDLPEADAGAVGLVHDVHFTTNLLRFRRPIGRDYAPLDSFVLYMCVAGEALVEALEVQHEPVSLRQGEAVLIPACLHDIRLTPVGEEAKLLETYIGA